MSAIVKRILLLSLALILSFALIGCATGGGLPQEEIDRIIDNTTTVQFDTVSLDMDMSMTMEVEGGSEEGAIDMAVDGTGVMDLANEEMQMAMNMAMDVSEMGEQEMATTVYVVAEWIYMNVEYLGEGDQWMKMELTEDMWQQQNQIGQQIELLSTAAEADYLGSEAVNGTDCHVFKVVPSMEALGELFSQQTSTMVGMDFSQFDLADWFKEMSVKYWIAKDTYWIMKTEIYMLMQLGPEDIGATEDDFGKVTMDMNIGMRFYDYNQPVSIILPPEALDAEEIPY